MLNESFHSVVWSRCPKTVFVGVRGVVASSIARFNEGTVYVFFNCICEHFALL